MHRINLIVNRANPADRHVMVTNELTMGLAIKAIMAQMQAMGLNTNEWAIAL